MSQQDRALVSSSCVPRNRELGKLQKFISWGHEDVSVLGLGQRLSGDLGSD